jgi:hypothetical protein
MRINRCLILMIINFLLLINPVVMASDYVDWHNHWAQEQIYDWVKKHLISGYPDGTLKPDQEITRAEFFSLVNRVFGYKELAGFNFPDVKESDWFAGEIAKACAIGYLAGYPDGTCKPHNYISRQESAVVLARLLKLETSGSLAVNFTDKELVPTWSLPAIKAMVNNGYLVGYPDGTFRPEKAITRAEALVILSRITGTLFNHFGVYDLNQVIEGNVTINEQGVVLKNTVITGNLYLTEGIGEGNVVLDNVLVKGVTRISGGGENSIFIKDSILGTIFVDSTLQKRIRLVAQGAAKIELVNAETDVLLEGAAKQGFKKVVVQGAKTELIGDFAEVVVKKASQIDLLVGTIENFIFTPFAEGSAVNLAPQTEVATLIIAGAVKVTGMGIIHFAEIMTNGVELDLEPKEMIVGKGFSVKIVGRGGIVKIPSGVIGASKKIGLTSVSVIGLAKFGEELKANVMPARARVNYQWLISDQKDGPYRNIVGAVKKTYQVGAQDVDQWIMVTAEGMGNYSGKVKSMAKGPIKPIEYLSSDSFNFDLYVDFGTPGSEVIGKLKKIVGINGTHGERGRAEIAWGIINYNPNQVGSYQAVGKIILPAGWGGEPINITATITIRPQRNVISNTLKAVIDVKVGLYKDLWY